MKNIWMYAAITILAAACGQRREISHASVEEDHIIQVKPEPAKEPVADVPPNPIIDPGSRVPVGPSPAVVISVEDGTRYCVVESNGGLKVAEADEEVLALYKANNDASFLSTQSTDKLSTPAGQQLEIAKDPKTGAALEFSECLAPVEKK